MITLRHLKRSQTKLQELHDDEDEEDEGDEEEDNSAVITRPNGCGARCRKDHADISGKSKCSVLRFEFVCIQ